MTIDYNIANSEYWYLVEKIYDFVLCFDIETGDIIRKSGFDKVCTLIDSYTNYDELMTEFKKTYVSDLSLDEFVEKTDVNYMKTHEKIDFVCLEIIENQVLRWYNYIIITKDNVATILIKDIHDLKSEEVRLKEISSIDKMTGLLNRMSFDDYVDQKVHAGHPFTLAFIDIDDFKLINDNKGHLMGDEVLKEFGMLLSEIFHGHSAIGRYGGDEFLMCIDGVRTEEELSDLMEELFKQLKKPFKSGNIITVSIGITIFPNSGQCRKELYYAADVTLYEVKKSSKNAYRFSKNISNGDAC